MATDNNTVTIETSSGGLLTGFNKLSLLRQFGLMVGLAASIAIGLAVVLWSKAPDYRVLFSNMQYADANEVIDQLNLLSIPYKFEGDARTILVPEEYVYQARLRLASEGFTNDKTVGFELLDQEQSLGVSQFMESARFRRGLKVSWRVLSRVLPPFAMPVCIWPFLKRVYLLGIKSNRARLSLLSYIQGVG